MASTVPGETPGLAPLSADSSFVILRRMDRQALSEGDFMVVRQNPITAEQAVFPSNGNLLLDQHGRVFDYLRIAVNETCNLRCIYCMPEEGIDFKPVEKCLTTDEILRLISIAASLGVRKIRFTGGEPLIYKELVPLIREVAGIPGIKSIHVTTNGLLLQKMAEDLLAAGVDGVNISLDTLHHDRFEEITRRKGLEKVLEGLSIALRIGFPSVKVNMVAMRSFNEDEIGDFVELAKENQLTVRFIELMPFDAHQIWNTGKFLGADRILEILILKNARCTMLVKDNRLHNEFVSKIRKRELSQIERK